ncbi:MAG TPA: SDR family oxidoreductase [Candidatus Dormibacteraeota bacterium]|nr:SDR family oxidoreductase [Candidatus Dormibacteraeota bacterium]
MGEDRLVCLVTGATAGIGLVTAEGLARTGAHVILGARTRERGEAARERIARATGSDRLELVVADLAVQAEVRRMAEDVARAHDRLDVLVNNAGGIRSRREETPDGIEWTWAVNHLAPFLLTNLLTNLLKASAPARVVTVSSDAHSGARLDLDDPQFTRRRYATLAVYGQSKLANILFTAELARRLQGTGVTANCLHPGFVGSEFGSKAGGAFGWAWPLVKLFALSPERGARTSIYLATSPEVADVTGRYFVRSRPATPSRQAQDADLARRLWEVSERMTGLVTAAG